jgi:glycosyltransferase involved in cell wall biosynthesis
MQMKILTIVCGMDKASGGLSQAIRLLYEESARLGAQVRLYAMDNSGKLDDKVVPDPALVQTTFIPTYGNVALRFNWSINFKRRVADDVKKSRPDIIHNHGVWTQPNHVAPVISRQSRIPLVLSAHGMLTPWALQYTKWKKIVALKLYQKKDLDTACILHATSDIEAAGYRAFGLKQPIAVIPNGIELPEWKNKCHANKEKREILFLSRIHPTKGLLNLVKAWSVLRPKGWIVLVAGPDEDEHKAEVESAITGAGLNDDFKFLGEVDSLAKWNLYRRADVFVLPTYSENFGLVVPEALSCGTPVITTKGAPWKALETHNCGWWIDIGVDALVAALRKAMEARDEERFDMGRRGRQLVQAKFTWPMAAAEMMHVYQWILEGGSRPSSILID